MYCVHILRYIVFSLLPDSGNIVIVSDCRVIIITLAICKCF